MEELV